MSTEGLFCLEHLGSPDNPLVAPSPARPAGLSTPARPSLLLQASAGTGKTYSLERIVLYLLVRPVQPLELRQILTVTFTEAATQELRERIRSLLFAFVHQPDERTRLLAEIGLSDQPTLSAADLERLTRQLDHFGSTHIHTIHGFCQWVLTRHALEAGLPRSFALDTMALQDAVRDYVRERLLPDAPWDLGPVATPAGPRDCRLADPAERTWLVDAVLSLTRQSREGADGLIPGLTRVVREGWFDPDLYRLPREAIHQLWLDSLAPQLDLIRSMETGALPVSNPEWAAFCSTLAAELQGLDGLEAPDYLETLGGAKGKTDTTPGPPTKSSTKDLLAFCRRVGGLHLLDLLCRDFQAFRQARPDFDARLGYDDLIRRVHQLVRNRANPAVQEACRSLGQDFQAVLLDEFQDTDRLQWEIFSTLFTEATVMAVGDPKQSIYGFRGADLGTFLEARPWFSARQELGRNFRSSARLQQCINDLFGPTFANFKTPALDIDYPRVAPGRDESAGPVIIQADRELPPVGLLSPDMGEASSASGHRRLIFNLAAAEITSLLAGGHRILEGRDESGAARDRSLGAEDICILCEKFRDAGIMRDLLAARGIPASIRGRGDLKDSTEVQELEVFCRALQNPRDNGALHCFLLGRLCGLSPGNLLDPAWFPVVEQVRSCLDEWRASLPKRGFLPVFSDLVRGHHLDGTDLWARLLAAEGDRGLRSQTNFTHLAELFQSWLADNPRGLGQPGHGFMQFKAELSEADDAPLRLDRDRGAVCIMTQHASKGLEFPVVFALVGLSGVKARGNSLFEVYDAHDGTSYRRCVDSWSLGEERKARVKERQDHEKLRLYYVAATRAKALLYLPWVPLPPGEKGSTKPVLLIEDWTSELVTVKGKGKNQEVSTRPPRMPMPQGPDYRIIREAAAQASDQPGRPVADPPAPASLLAPPAGPGQPRPSWQQRRDRLQEQILPPPARALVNLESASFTSCKKQLQTGWQRPAIAGRSWQEHAGPGDDEEPAGLANPALPQLPADIGSAPAAQPLTARLPAGKDWGLAFHDLMDSLDYAGFLDAWDQRQTFAAVPALARLTRSVLSSRGLRDDLLPDAGQEIRNHPLLQEVHHALSARLPALTVPGVPDCLSLADLVRSGNFVHQRELDFHATIPRDTHLLESLQCLHGQAGTSIHLGEGYLNGAIDLLFQGPDGKWHIVDWKTNTPGNAASVPAGNATADTAAACAGIMEESTYHLQALIYQSVLALWLASRGQADRLGSVWYIFTRAGLDIPDQAPQPAPWVMDASRLTRPLIKNFLRETGLAVQAGERTAP